MMLETKLLASRVEVISGEVNIQPKIDRFGLGLLRDERMWEDPSHIDLLRLMFLGQDILGESFNKHETAYLEVFKNKIYDVLKVGTGEAAVIRLLCMPYNMIFPTNFDVKSFVETYNLEETKVKQRIQTLAGETESYHGCRGVRVTVQREDISRLWCKGVLLAAQQAFDEGAELNLQILLSMVTFPQEVKMFIQTFEEVIKELDIEPKSFIRGISIMIETSGAYHLLEDILDQSGDFMHLNGALFGGNDFTAACLNMNRADSAATIIPAYKELDIFEHSPFHHINKQIVGKAINQSLRRTRLLSLQNQRDYLMGLGGEIAGSWLSVQWLSKNAEPLGLYYVSTPPDRFFYALLASAKANVEAIHGETSITV